MSDGMSDSRREESATVAIHSAAERLADALEEVYDQAFGYPPLTLDIANAVLKRVRVELVRR